MNLQVGESKVDPLTFARTRTVSFELSLEAWLELIHGPLTPEEFGKVIVDEILAVTRAEGFK